MLGLAKRQVDGAEAGQENDPGSRVLVLPPLVSVTSEFPLAPAGILSSHPEGPQRGRMEVGKMKL